MTYWKIPFVSRDGDLYEIRINGAEGSTPIQLTGADSPIMTQEDDERDMFLPVRIQSGYIRIVDTGKDALGHAFNWTDLIPTSAVARPVTLWKGVRSGSMTTWSVVWQGFIRPETFSGDLRMIPQERDFPILCPFATLEAFDVTTADTSVQRNFAWLILYLLQNYYTIQIDTFYFSRPLDVVGWLQHKFQWQNLFDDDGTPKYNGLALLEEICKFWGWTAHMDGSSVYFLQPDDTTAGGLVAISYADMDDLANNTGIQPTTLNWNTATIANKTILRDGTLEEYIQGVKNVRVTADINKVSQLLKIPFGDFADDYRMYAIDPGVQTWGSHPWEYILYDSFLDGERNFTKDNDDIWMHFQFDDTTQSAIPRYAALIVNEISDEAPEDKHNYNFSGKIILEGGVGVPNLTNYSLRVVSKKTYSLSDGAIVINMQRGQDRWSTTQTDCHITIAVRFGNKWYDSANNQWTDNFATIPNILFNPNKLADYRILNGPYMYYTGIGIPVTNMGGVIQVYFYGADVTSFIMTSFELTFVRKIQSELINDDSENTYEIKNNASFQTDVAVDTIFATDNNNEYGAGIIMTPNGYYASVVEYSTSGGSEPQHPEQHLVDRIAAYGSTVKRAVSFGARNNTLTPVSPATKITDENGKTYAPVSISHDWANDVTNYTLLEL